MQRLRTIFKPEAMTQAVVPGQVGTAVWQTGLKMGLDFKDAQQTLCLDKSYTTSKHRDRDKKTFSPRKMPLGDDDPPFKYSPRYPSRRRPRPPSYHRVAAGRRDEEAFFDRRSRTFARYSRKANGPKESIYYSYYSDEDSTSYYYIDQALPYDQWKELLRRQGSLCEIYTSPSLAFATEWLV